MKTTLACYVQFFESMRTPSLVFSAFVLLLGMSLPIHNAAAGPNIPGCKELPTLAPWGCREMRVPLRYNDDYNNKVTKVIKTITLSYAVWPVMEKGIVPQQPTSFEKDFIVLLPGGPLGYQFYDEALLLPLARAFNIVMVDYRGVDKSAIPGLQHIDMDVYNTSAVVEDLEGVRRHLLGDRQWHVFGHSYGVQAALAYVSRYGQYVQSVVLSNGAKDYKWTLEQLRETQNIDWRKKMAALIAAPLRQEFFALYQQLEESAKRNQLLVWDTKDDGTHSDTIRVSQRDLGFTTLRFLDAYGGEEMVEVFKKWLKQDADTLSWLRWTFDDKQKYDIINTSFGCGEILPQIEQMGWWSQPEDAPLLAQIKREDCAAATGTSHPQKIDFSHIQNRVLVVSSGLDQIIPSHYQRILFDALPNAKFLLFQEAKHFPYRDHPEYTELLVQFLIGK